MTYGARLGKTFGFAGDDDQPAAPRLYDPNSLHFSFDLGERPNTASGSDNNEARATSRAQTSRGRTANRPTRHPTPTLKIQLVGEDKLKNTLFDSMRRVEEMRQSMSRSGSPSRSPSSPHRSPNKRTEHGDTDDQHDGGDYSPQAILQLPGESAPKLSHSNTSPSKLNSHHSRPPPGKYVGKSALAKSAGEDTKIPIFPFTAGAEFDKAGDTRKPSSAPDGKTRKNRKDGNEKAKFLPVPTGKFRREFSDDHPLAAGGRGKYSKELEQGLTPQGLPLELPKKPANSVDDNVKDAIELAEKVEKLTYEAGTSVIDEKDDVDKLRKEMNAAMKILLEEERNAEDERLMVLAGMKDPEEKQRLEQIFAEQRRRASEKIVAATRDYDKTIKQAMLKTLNLGPAAAAT